VADDRGASHGAVALFISLAIYIYIGATEAHAQLCFIFGEIYLCHGSVLVSERSGFGLDLDWTGLDSSGLEGGKGV
jgi:hypothetical protein